MQKDAAAHRRRHLCSWLKGLVRSFGDGANERMFASDVWLRRHAHTFRDFVQPRTTPMFISEGEVDSTQSPLTFGSGVLVHLGQRYFLFTAGHCVAECRLPGRVVYLGITHRQRHKFRLPVANTQYVRTPDGTVDYGYIEIAPVDAKTIERNSMVFSGVHRIELRDPEPRSDDDWLVVAGYPAEAYLNNEEARLVTARFLVGLTLVKRHDALPEHIAPPPPGYQVFDLWLPPEQVDSPDPNTHEDAEPIKFGGVSGGGCWEVDLEVPPDKWSPDQKPKLCGIHAATIDVEKRDVDGNKHYLLREVSVRHHLELIAKDYADLRELIYQTWPATRPEPR